MNNNSFDKKKRKKLSYYTYKQRRKREYNLFKRFLIVIIAIAGALLVFVNMAMVFIIRDYRQNTAQMLSLQNTLARQLSQLIDDSKEIRKTLDLPELLYEIDDNIEDDYSEEDPNEVFSEEELLLSQAKDILQNYYLEQVSKSFSKALDDLGIFKMSKNLNFMIKQKNSTLVVRYDSEIVANIQVLYDEQYSITGFKYDSKIIGSSAKIPLEQLPAILKQLSLKLEKNIVRAKKLSDEINRVFQSKDITLLFLSNKSIYTHKKFLKRDEWNVYNITRDLIFTVNFSYLDLSIKITGNNIDADTLTNTQIAKILTDEIISVNYKTVKESLSYAHLEQLLSYTSDKHFVLQMNSLGLTTSTQTRIDDDYYYLDIVTIDGLVKVGAYAIQRSNGSFWIADKDDIPIRQEKIFNLASPEVKKQISSQNILLVGSHNQLADTIIIAHVGEDNNVKLISIPRDLFYKGRKINWYFKRYSPSNFNEIVSEISGLPIRQYIYVDMYAFVTIIDILDGININLKKDLIDTTYKIKENGHISYLNYEQGEHYLTGIEALRIARSRHSTTDFDRAERQQALIEGIQQKLTSVDKISSFISVLKIIDQIRPYISTNISSFEIAQKIQKYRNSIIVDKIVLNSSNILYASYSNIYKYPEFADKIPKEEQGQWILLPQQNDWYALQNFIETFILK